MVSFFYNMEKKIGKYAIKNIIMWVVVLEALGYLLMSIIPGFVEYIALNPILVLKGQVWRLVSWIMIPPSLDDNAFLMLVAFYCDYWIGTTLERLWGKFYMNVFFFSGMILCILTNFAIYAWAYFANGVTPQSLIGIYYITYFDGATFYLITSILLAFSVCFAEVSFLLFFVLPIKAKYLGLIYFAFCIYDAVRFGPLVIVYAAASLLNFGLFYLIFKKTLFAGRVVVMSRSEANKRKENANKKSQPSMKPGGGVSKHKCAICGQTNDTNPNLEFRFCSKCEGNYEYCQEHLFTHTHVKR